MTKLFFKNKISSQRGFTLVELLIAIAITGSVATIIMLCISQLLAVNSSTVNRMTAIKQMELAIDSMRPDIQMGQQIYLNDPDVPPDPDVFLAIYWMDWENNSNQSTKYSWNSSTERVTRLSSDGNVNIIATNIASKPDVKKNYLDAPNNVKYNWKITVEADVDGYKSATESRTFVVKPRSGS